MCATEALLLAAILCSAAPATTLFSNDFESDPAGVTGSPDDLDPSALSDISEPLGQTQIQVLCDDVPGTGIPGSNKYLKMYMPGTPGTSRPSVDAYWDDALTVDKLVITSWKLYMPSANAGGSWCFANFYTATSPYKGSVGLQLLSHDTKGGVTFWDQGTATNLGTHWDAVPLDQWVDVTVKTNTLAGKWSVTIGSNTWSDLTYTRTAGVNNRQGDLYLKPNTGTSGIDANYYFDNIVVTDVPGDANADGFVDDLDASILGKNWLIGSGATWGMGDFNGDYAVNDQDAAILAAHWNPPPTGDASVPEPGALVLLASAVAAIGLLRRR
jgi:hypothetical protein